MENQPPRHPLLKLLLEFGPLVVFFVANNRADIFWATGAFMVAITISVAASYWLEKQVPKMPLVTGIFVLIFGGLTLYLQDETFIKMKPTIVNAIFAVILLAGLLFNQLFIKMLLGSVFALDAAGWRKLTLRWGLFFAFLAVLNEIIWRNFDTDTWVNFKVFGIMPLTLIFSFAQLPLMQRHQVTEASDEPSAEH